MLQLLDAFREELRGRYEIRCASARQSDQAVQNVVDFCAGKYPILLAYRLMERSVSAPMVR